jgi:hypothetical protein
MWAYSPKDLFRKQCIKPSRQDIRNRDEHGFEAMSFYFGLGLGFTLGIWVVFCILLFKKA